ncbi:hypothetical protein L6255_00925 [Candidatus Parcubacteria bacterium]|nr:hypothetical protein [Patescibacteria group bacterium]MBU4381267.1 hypothetical protein [Patescibacteria group bacterium]MCG2688984.1 hypothetical protein [Candidatus Parcubacteria bacterium]
MASYLITQSTFEKRQGRAHEILSQFSITRDENIYLVSDDTKKGIGIESIRHLKKFLSKKSRAGESRGVLILDTQRLTVPAQNALLKTLEEPPQNTQIILASPSEKLLLETIISRCILISLQNNPRPKDDLPKVDNLFLLPPNGVLDFFATNPKVYASQNNALEFLETQESYLLSDMDKIDPKRLTTLYKYKPLIFNTNASLRLVLENIFI